MKRQHRRWAGRASLLTGAGVTAIVLASAPVSAQDEDPFTALEYRQRPEYSTPPITIGAFEVSPRIEARIEYVDRVFASSAFEADDVVFTVSPQVAIADRRPDRVLRLNLSTGFETYLDNSANDRVQALAQGIGRFRLGTLTRPYAGFEVRLNNTQTALFTNSSNVVQPLELFSYSARAGVDRDFGPVTATVEGRYMMTEYSGDIVFRDTLVDGSFRDNAIISGRARIAYSVNPAQRIYAEGRYGRFEYDTSTPPPFPAFFLRDRSATNASIRVGFERRLTELLQFDANIGYSTQDYDDPVQDTINAFSFEGSLYYSPTPITRFRLQAGRTIDETVNPLFSSFLRTEFSVSAEHELRRNLVVGTQGRFSSYNAGPLGNIGKEYQGSAFARYYVSPRWSLRLEGNRFRRTGLLEGSQTRAILSAGYNF